MMVSQGKKSSEIFNNFVLYPQILHNVEFPTKNSIESDIVIKTIEHYKKKLGKFGRILVRPSGTEPLIRIMVEGENGKLLSEAISAIQESFHKA